MMRRWYRAAAVLVVTLGLAGMAVGQPKTTNYLSQRTHRLMEDVHKAMDAENFVKAEAILTDIMESRRSSAFEKAVVWRTRGYIAAQQADYAGAVTAFRNAVESEVLEARAQNDLLFNIGQLYLAEGAHAQAIQWLTHWRDAEDVPSGQGLMTLASALAQDDQVEAAREAALAALGSGDTPRPDWYNFAATSAARLKDYDDAADLLKQGLLIYPDQPALWVQLAAVLAEQGRYGPALAVLQIAESKGFLDQPHQVTFLGQLSLDQGVPALGARVVAAARQDGRMEETVPMLDLLSTLWTAAREREPAMTALADAAPKARHGRLWVRLGQMQMGDEDWSAAVGSYAAALDAGGLTNEGAARLNHAIALAKSGRNDDALSAFRRARRFNGVAETANAWITDLTGGKRATN